MGTVAGVVDGLGRSFPTRIPSERLAGSGVGRVDVGLGSLRGWLGSNAGRLAALTLSIVASCLVAELLWGVFRPQAGFHLRSANTQYEYEPDAFVMPGVDPDHPAHSTINASGVRQVESDLKENGYRILFVGGSTTECFYIDDERTWPSLVGRHLNDATEQVVTVGAAGYSEYSTAHHTRFLAESPLIDDVDCVVVLAGANDLARLLMGFELNAQPGPWWYESNLLQLAKYVWNVRLKQGYFVDRTGQQLSLRRRFGREILPREIDWDVAVDEYADRLRALVEAARQREVRLVFVTQPVLWDDFLTTFGSKRLWLARVEPMMREWEFLNAPALRATIDRYNNAMQGVGDEMGVEVIDASAELSGREFLFYDDYHLNLAGCREMARVVGEYLSARDNESE